MRETEGETERHRQGQEETHREKGRDRERHKESGRQGKPSITWRGPKTANPVK